MPKTKRRIALIVHDVRSAHNVGSLLRTADGLGVYKVYLTGITPYPESPGDERPPHVRRRVTARIAKTALGAEKSVRWQRPADINILIDRLSRTGWQTAALEQTKASQDLPVFMPSGDIALVVGNEVGGLDRQVLEKVDLHLSIPMLGRKESCYV